MILVFGVFLLMMGCSERMESSYVSLAEAKAGGGITRGWIPSSLADAVYAIREKHDLDTNEVWGTFRFPKGQDPLDPSIVESMSSDVIPKLSFRVSGVGFWPALLCPPIQASRASSEGFQFFSEPKSHFIFAINRDGGLGFYWSVKDGMP